MFLRWGLAIWLLLFSLCFSGTVRGQVVGAPRRAPEDEASISGRVTHRFMPAAGVRIFCQAQACALVGAEALTGEDGTYRLEHLPAGMYNVMLDPPEGLTAVAIGGLRLETGEHCTGADLELRPGGLVGGIVTRLGGVVPGAIIAAWGPARPPSTTSCQTATTDAQGLFLLRLPEGENILRYTGNLEDYPREFCQPQEWRLGRGDIIEGGPQTGASFLLRFAPTLRGQVLLPDGQPAAGIQVGATHGAFEQDLTHFFKAETDVEGNFAFSVPAPTVKLDVSDGRYRVPSVVLARDLDRGFIGSALVYNPELWVQIRLVEGAYVVAQASDTEDQPVPGAEVRVLVSYAHSVGQWTPGACSDDQGRLRVGPLLPGVSLWLLPMPETDLLVVDQTWYELGTIILAPGEEREFPPLRLNPLGRMVRGWVGDEQQQPVEGAIVYVFVVSGLPSFEQTVHTNEEGRFEATGLPARGKVWIVAAHPTDPLFEARELDPDWGFQPGLLLEPVGSTTGHVVDGQGLPIGGAVVGLRSDLEFSPCARELLRRLYGEGFRHEVETDVEGKWTLTGLVPGASYGVSVSAPGSTSGRGYGIFTPKSGQTVDLGEMVLEVRE